MDINNLDNIINQISNESIEFSKIDLTFYLVHKQKNADFYYDSKEITLEPEVIKWLKENIKTNLNLLKMEDDNNEKSFFVSKYNHEFKKTDNIAVIHLDESKKLKEKKEMLINCIENNNDLYNEKNTNFQIIKLKYESKKVYFGYYRGVKSNSSKSRKKKKLIFKNSNSYGFIEDVIIDIGGNIDFFIIEDYIFIINLQNFEYAFDYRDHIIEQRDINLSIITSMDFFKGKDSNKDKFEEKCKRYIFSRSLAQISKDTLTILQEKFDERCEELKKIKENVPENDEEKEKYIKKYGSLWELFEFIDLENKKIIFKEDMQPTPLIHFFANKIVKSFLTEDYKVATGYEEIQFS